MNWLLAAITWIADPAHQTGPTGIWSRLWEHLGITASAVALAALVGVPLGWFVGHTGHGRVFVVATAGVARAVPTLGMLTLVALAMGVGVAAPVVALVILAIPSILAGAYAGIDAIERSTIDAAYAVGYAPRQVLARVEVPLGLPALVGGLRSATLQVVATATLAAWVGGGGLGTLLFLGLKTQDYAQMLAASMLVVGLAIVLEILLGVVEYLATHLTHRQATNLEGS